MSAKMYIYCKTCRKSVVFDEKEYRATLLNKGEITCPECGNVVNKRRSLRNGFSREPIANFIKLTDTIADTKMANYQLDRRRKAFNNDYGVDMSDIEDTSTIDGDAP